MKTTLPPFTLPFNIWAWLTWAKAKRLNQSDLPYIVTPRVNHSHLERVLMARK